MNEIVLSIEPQMMTNITITEEHIRSRYKDVDEYQVTYLFPESMEAGKRISLIIPKYPKKFYIYVSYYAKGNAMYVRKMFTIESQAIGNTNLIDYCVKCIHLGQQNKTIPFATFQLQWLVSRIRRTEHELEFPSVNDIFKIDFENPSNTPPLSVRLDRYLTFCTMEESNAFFWRYVTEPNSDLGRLDALTFLIDFLKIRGFSTMKYILDARRDVWYLVEERFPKCRRLFHATEIGTVFPGTFDPIVDDNSRDWNKIDWTAKENDALKKYRGNFYWVMNNFMDPDAAMHEDVREEAQNYSSILENALEEKSQPRSGIFWRGSSSYNWPENVIESGSRFTSVTTNPATAIVFALGHGTKMGRKTPPSKTDGEIPNASGLQIISISRVPMVRGNLSESELVLPPHMRVRFIEYQFTRVKKSDWETYKVLDNLPETVVFLTRVYEIIGLLSSATKRARLDSCISCGQSATHICSGCNSAYFCSDEQCKGKSDVHLNHCSKN